MVDRSIASPYRIIEDVLTKVDQLIFLEDFIILVWRLLEKFQSSLKGHLSQPYNALIEVQSG